MKKTIAILFAMGLFASCIGCSIPYFSSSSTSSSSQSSETSQISSVTSNVSVSAPSSSGSAIVYTNNQYGFTFTLPSDWAGYTIVTDTWTGTNVATGKSDKSGPIIKIRNPKWTSAKPYEDIPIMVIPVSLWSDIQNEKYSVSAAPIPPTLLGQNTNYVFALPARYNYDYAEGYQQVESILANNPLKAFNP